MAATRACRSWILSSPKRNAQPTLSRTTGPEFARVPWTSLTIFLLPMLYTYCFRHYPWRIHLCGSLQAAADAAREAGTILFAVGVGPDPTEDTLLDIAGDEDNVFRVDNFDELDGELLS